MCEVLTNPASSMSLYISCHFTTSQMVANARQSNDGTIQRWFGNGSVEPWNLYSFSAWENITWTYFLQCFCTLDLRYLLIEFIFKGIVILICNVDLENSRGLSLKWSWQESNRSHLRRKSVEVVEATPRAPLILQTSRHMIYMYCALWSVARVIEPTQGYL